MIFGDIRNWDGEKGTFSPAIANAIEYLKNTDFSKFENGKYEIQGDSVFATISEADTKHKSDLNLETHIRYIDIHYLISGQEIISFGLKNEKSQVTEDLRDVKDLILYKDIHDELELTLYPGMYAVFFPSDIHRSRCRKGESTRIRKVIIKVEVSLLNT